MLRGFFVITSFLVCQTCFGQFTKVTDQPIAQDGVSSMGVAWVDYDNDGDDDVYIITDDLTGPAMLPLLYRNDGSGSFTKITSGVLVGTNQGFGRNSCWGDYNNDGLADVFVAYQHQNNLYKNDGDGNFSLVNNIPTMNSTEGDNSGGTWGDYDNDGDLDLFMSRYRLSDPATNILYQNNGDGTFTETSSPVNAPGRSQDATWIDFDNNGTLDLFVANYGDSPSFLYSNDGMSNFTAITNQPISTVSGASLGASWADYDNDGDFDAFLPVNVNSTDRFFENNNGVLEEVTRADLKINSGKSASAAWADFNNDGFIDIICVGGDDGDVTSLYRNNGDKTFTDVSSLMGVNNISYSYGVASSDYDQDGFIDFLVVAGVGSELDPDDILYHNTPNDNHWISIKLRGTSSNRDGIGAVVKILADDHSQYRTVQSKTGFNSQNSLRAHFGVGQATILDQIVVEWPGKGLQVLDDQPVDEYITLIEPGSFPVAPSDAMAEIAGEDVIVTWADNSTDETGFRIERSVDGGEFEFLANLPPNTTTYTDEDIAANKLHQYHISAKFDDAHSFYANSNAVVIVAVQEEFSPQVYPMPVVDCFYITRQSAFESEGSLLNTTGQLLTRYALVEGEQRISVNDLPPGMYIFQTPLRKFKVVKR